MCSSVFSHWSADEFANENSERNVSVSGCGNFLKAEKDLDRLIRLATTYQPRSLDRAKLLSLLCHYAFKDCSESSNDENICLEFLKFQSEITEIRRLMPISCLTIPRCANNLISPNESRTSNKTTCPKPLIPTHSKYAREHGFYCSPPCDQSNWKNRLGVEILNAVMYGSAPIQFIGVVVLFVTWAKAKESYVEINIYTNQVKMST